jgi:hypothetical protein
MKYEDAQRLRITRAAAFLLAFLDPRPNSHDAPLATRRDSGVGIMRLSGFVAMFHDNDYISLLVSFIDIPVSLDNLFQHIRSIYDWS